MEKTNIRTAIMVIAIFVAILAIAAAVLMTPRASAHMQDDPPDQTAYKYILREHNGYVAVFPADDQEKPSYTSRMPVALLPDADRKNLESGIKVKNEEELTHLLEDLTS